MGIRTVVPTNYDPKGERFLIASRFPTPPLAYQFQEDQPEVPMADNRAMAQLLQAPTVGGNVYQDNINEYVSQAAAANYNQGNNRGGNFNQSQLYRHQVNQAPAYQAPIPQTQNVSQTDFERYVKANDAVLRIIQSQ
nr:hypothetical protein [Tanacetum cinerariifolium]